MKDSSHLPYVKDVKAECTPPPRYPHHRQMATGHLRSVHRSMWNGTSEARVRMRGALPLTCGAPERGSVVACRAAISFMHEKDEQRPTGVRQMACRPAHSPRIRPQHARRRTWPLRRRLGAWRINNRPMATRRGLRTGHRQIGPTRASTTPTARGNPGTRRHPRRIRAPRCTGTDTWNPAHHTRGSGRRTRHHRPASTRRLHRNDGSASAPATRRRQRGPPSRD